MKNAIQLYSLREMIEREGVEAVFEAVSKAGFEGIEFAGFYGLTPEEMKTLIEKYNLNAISAHLRKTFLL